MFFYKIDIIDALKNAGYTTYKIRNSKLLSEGTLQKFRKKDTNLNLDTINTVCLLLNCSPSDLLGYVPDDQKKD